MFSDFKVILKGMFKNLLSDIKESLHVFKGSIQEFKGVLTNLMRYKGSFHEINMILKGVFAKN